MDELGALPEPVLSAITTAAEAWHEYCEALRVDAGVHKAGMASATADDALMAAIRAYAAAEVQKERKRWEKALAQAGRMVDPLNPAGTPGSYARGFDVGVETTLRTVRENHAAAIRSQP